MCVGMLPFRPSLDRERLTTRFAASVPVPTVPTPTPFQFPGVVIGLLASQSSRVPFPSSVALIRSSVWQSLASSGLAANWPLPPSVVSLHRGAMVAPYVVLDVSPVAAVLDVTSVTSVVDVTPVAGVVCTARSRSTSASRRASSTSAFRKA